MSFSLLSKLFIFAEPNIPIIFWIGKYTPLLIQQII